MDGAFDRERRGVSSSYLQISYRPVLDRSGDVKSIQRVRQAGGYRNDTGWLEHVLHHPACAKTLQRVPPAARAEFATRAFHQLVTTARVEVLTTWTVKILPLSRF